MARLPGVESLSLAEYLAGEARRTRPYEYLDGQVYPLAEPSPQHERIRANLEAALRGPAQAEGSRLYAGAARLRVGHNRVYYPDLMVVSQPGGPEPYVEYPALIVEVAGWETERTDRGEKLLVYQGLPALQMYLIAHSERRLVEVVERGLRGNWHYYALGSAGEVELYSPQARLSLEAIYEGLP